MINLLPDKFKSRGTSRHQDSATSPLSASKIHQAFPKIHFGVSLNSFFLQAAVILAVLSSLWLGLNMQVKAKTKELASLGAKETKRQNENQNVAHLEEQKNDLIKTLEFYETVYSDKLDLIEKLKKITEIIPRQIWLTNILSQEKPNITFVIQGAAVSSMEAENLASITEFVTKLKQTKNFIDAFNDFQLGSLQSEKRGNFICMNFSLTCKFK